MDKERLGMMLATGKTLVICANSHPAILHQAGDCPLCAKLDYIDRLKSDERALLDEITALKER